MAKKGGADKKRKTPAQCAAQRVRTDRNKSNRAKRARLRKEYWTKRGLKKDGSLVGSHPVVRLKEDAGLSGIKAGQKGTVVHAYKSQGERFYEVEFINPDGPVVLVLSQKEIET